jgi:hypothetical protein
MVFFDVFGWPTTFTMVQDCSYDSSTTHSFDI